MIFDALPRTPTEWFGIRYSSPQPPPTKGRVGKTIPLSVSEANTIKQSHKNTRTTAAAVNDEGVCVERGMQAGGVLESSSWQGVVAWLAAVITDVGRLKVYRVSCSASPSSSLVVFYPPQDRMCRRSTRIAVVHVCIGLLCLPLLRPTYLLLVHTRQRRCKTTIVKVLIINNTQWQQ